MATSIKKNTFLNLIRTLSSIIFPLITFPYTRRVLHAENIGKIDFCSSIISYIQLFATLGITTYAIRECSKVKNDKNELGDVASQIISLNIISMIIAYILFAFLLLFWRKLDGYRLLIIIQSISILFTTLGAEWLNVAMEDFKFITLRTFCFQIISIICMPLFVHKPEHYIIYAGIGVLSSSGVNIVNIIYRRRFCKIRFTIHIEWKRHLKPIITLFAICLSSIIYVNVDTTMLGIIRGDFEVGLYSTAVKLYTIINTTVASIVQVVISKLTFQYAQKEKDYNKINDLLKYAAQFIMTFGFPCVIGINLIASETITIIAGNEYLGAVLALHILTIALFFSYLGGFVGNIILTPQGKDKVNLKNCCISAIINIILNCIFIPKWGLYAAAATTAISELIAFFLALIHVEKDVDKRGIAKLAVSPILGCLVMIIISIPIKYFVHVLVYRFLLVIISCSVSYFIVLIICHNEIAVGIIKTLHNKITKQ